MSEKMNIYQKILEVKKVITQLGLEKDKKGYNFSYVTGNQILGKITPRMNEVGLILVPEIDKESISTTKEEKGRWIVQGTMTYTWINTDNPEEKLKTDWVFFGKHDQDIAQAFGSALTYAERYFLLKFFGIATDLDDPDLKNYNENSTANAFITNPQRANMAVVANSDLEIINQALKDFGYTNSKYVKIEDYDKIIERIKKAAALKGEVKNENIE